MEYQDIHNFFDTTQDNAPIVLNYEYLIERDEFTVETSFINSSCLKSKIGTINQLFQYFNTFDQNSYNTFEQNFSYENTYLYTFLNVYALCNLQNDLYKKEGIIYIFIYF